MTQETVSLLITFIGVATLLVPSIPIMFQPVGTKKTLTPVGRALIAVGVLMFVVGLTSIEVTRKANKSAQLATIKAKREDDSIRQMERKGYEDSLKSYHIYTTELLAKYNLKIDSINKTVSKIDTGGQGNSANSYYTRFGVSEI
jgi:hypothetical protein